MGDLKKTDLDQMTAISGQIGQDIANSVTFVESQITVLSDELAQIAPLSATSDIQLQLRFDPNPRVIANSAFGINQIPPDGPAGLAATAGLAEADLPGGFTPGEQTVVFPEASEINAALGTVNIPTAPTLSDLGTVPEVPVVALPGSPVSPTAPGSLFIGDLDLALPGVPTLNLPAYGETLPTYDVDLPSFTFEYIEQPYSSGLLDAATARLLNDVTNGGTGLGATIEQDIFDRASERDARNIDIEITRFKNQSSVAGFDLPIGVMLDGVNDIISKHNDKLADLSRDIAIEQARLAQNNTQFAITQSISLEGTLINFTNNVADRAFQAARSVAEFQIAFHNAEILGYNARLERFAKGAEIHVELLRAETVKLELYKAELQKLDSNIAIQKLKIETYNANVARLSSQIQLFNAEVGAANLTSEFNRLKVSLYGAQIDSFVATLSKDRNDIDLHNAELRSTEVEFAKIQTEIALQNSRLETVRVNSANLVQELNAKLDNQRNLLSEAQNEINKFATVSNRVTTREQTLNSLMANDINRYNAEVDAEKSAIALEQDNVRILLDRAVKDLDRIVSVTQMNMDKNFKEWDFRTVVAQSVLAAKQFILEAGARSDDQTITNL